MEKPKPKRKKRKRKTSEVIWRKILERDLQLQELSFFGEALHARMQEEAFELEVKRSKHKPGYVV